MDEASGFLQKLGLDSFERRPFQGSVESGVALLKFLAAGVS